VRENFQAAILAIAVLCLPALPLAGQVTVGDNLNLSANGSISANYLDTTGNEIGSSHGLGFGGTAGLSGYYYNPNFISFTANPYYNQSRSNSEFASITNASGVTLSSNIFAGSHFPGAVNYSTTYNSTGNYGIPGINSLDTNSNAQNVGVTWSELLPNWPTITAGIQHGSSNYSLYGTNEGGRSGYDSFFLSSSYKLNGFNLSGGFTHSTSDALLPGILVGGHEATSQSDSTGYTFGVGHALPWNGSWSTYFNRTDLSSNYLGYRFNGDIDRMASVIGLNPTAKLHFSVEAEYTDNLSGSIYQALVPGASGSGLAGGNTTNMSTVQGSAGSASGVVEGTSLQEASHAWNFLVNGSYSFAPNLQLQGAFERREQTYLAANYGSNLYNAGVFYTRAVAGGYFGSSVSVFESSIDNSDSHQFGFNINANYNRQIGQWLLGGYFNYAQNAQTLLVSYTSSFYNFSGNVARRFGRWYWTANAGGGRSGLTAQPDTKSTSESFGTSIGNNRISASAQYAKSAGNGLAGGTGLVPTPLPPIIPPELLVIYGGTSYSFALSGSPVRHLQVTGSYTKTRNDLTNQGVFSYNNYETANAFFQYQLRQLGIQGGYTHLIQGFSASGLPPARVNSFSIGVYRWFNFF
jgi:hypothetical protein